MTEHPRTNTYHVVVSAEDAGTEEDGRTLYIIDETFGYAAMVTSRLIQRILSARFEKHGVLFGEWPILLFLWAKGTASQNDLSNLISIGEGTIARSVSRMEKKGLVTRERNVNDRREYIVQLTPKGIGLRDILLAETDALSRSMSDALGAEELDALLETHNRLQRALRAIDQENRTA